MTFEEEHKIEVAVLSLRENSKLAYPLFYENGDIAIPAYELIEKSSKDELIEKGISLLYYIKPKKEKNLKSYVRSKSYTGPRSISEDVQAKSIDIMDQIQKEIEEKKKINCEPVKELAKEILADLDKSKSVFVNLLSVQKFDDYTYTHSLNVGTISMVFARHLGLSEDEVVEIGVGGYLHDIGKALIPIDIINKPGKLTEDEFKIIKKHPGLGYSLIMHDDTVTQNIKEMVLYHHEKLDGTGYPTKLKGDEIHLEYHIVGLADIFDALSTQRSYKPSYSTKESLDIISKIEEHFEVSLKRKFLNCMKTMYKEEHYYPEGSLIVLNTKETAKIVVEDRKTIFFPTVQLISDAKGNDLKRKININLNNDFTRTASYRIEQ